MKLKKGYVFETKKNKYTIVKQIGEGGAAFVFHVKDENGNDFVSKFLKVDPKSEKTERFKNEISFQKETDNKYIVKILDDGVLEENIDGNNVQLYFYIMNKYESDFKKYLKEEHDLSNKLKLYTDLCRAVRFIHTKGHYHRDIKPENCLYDKENNILLLSDFGIAHFAGSTLTKKSDKLCNDKYAAPEQRKDSNYVISKKSDIFALGLILNEIFTKNVPLGLDYVTISDVNPIYGRLDEYVKKMLKHNPNERLNSLSDVINVIDDLNKNVKDRLEYVKIGFENYSFLEKNLLNDIANDFVYFNYCVNNEMPLTSKKILESKYRFEPSKMLVDTLRLIAVKEKLEELFKTESQQPSNNNKALDEYLKKTNDDKRQKFISIITSYDIIEDDGNIKNYCIRMFNTLYDYHKDIILNSAVSILSSFLEPLTYVGYFKIINKLKNNGIFHDEVSGEIYVNYIDSEANPIKEKYINIKIDFLTNKFEDLSIIKDGMRYKVIFGNEKNKQSILLICEHIIKNGDNIEKENAKYIKHLIEEPFEIDNINLDDVSISLLCRYGNLVA